MNNERMNGQGLQADLWAQALSVSRAFEACVGRNSPHSISLCEVTRKAHTFSTSVTSFCFAEFRENEVLSTLFHFASFFTKGGSVEALYFSFEKQSIQDYLPQELKMPLSRT